MNTTPLGFNPFGGKKLSPYNIFVKAEYKKIKDAHPSKKGTEIMQLVAKKWRESKTAKSLVKSPVKSR